MSRRRGFRVWGTVWAVLQFALPAAATFADARLERESVVASFSHVESRSDASCRPVHPAECALCQVVSRASAPGPESSSWLGSVSAVEQPAIAEVPQHAREGLTRLSRARAPPLS
jgi:hypothetical protein